LERPPAREGGARGVAAGFEAEGEKGGSRAGSSVDSLGIEPGRRIVEPVPETAGTHDCQAEPVKILERVVNRAPTHAEGSRERLPGSKLSLRKSAQYRQRKVVHGWEA
jgi:hypothetical protein